MDAFSYIANYLVLNLSLIGNAISVLGSLFLAFAVVESPYADQLIKGKKRKLAIILIGKFRWGVALIILGFLLQIADVFVNS